MSLVFPVKLLTVVGAAVVAAGVGGGLDDQIVDDVVSVAIDEHAASSRSRPSRMMRRHEGSLEPMDEVALTQESAPNWNMKTECCGVFACAAEGGDCCCKGDVRLGKENADGVAHWGPWTPVDRWVSCHGGVLGNSDPSEGKYCQCKGYCPVTCDSPTKILEVVQKLNGTTCANDASAYKPGDKCSLQCEAGYRPTTEALQCRTARFEQNEHVWSPKKFTCEGNPCAAPTWIQNAATPACAEGSHVNHDSTCAVKCKPGYIASAAVLNCNLGMMSPPDFACSPMSCGVEEGWIVDQHEDGPCQEGSLVKSGEKCHGRCKAGYSPSVNSISCEKGVFTPAKFTCVPSACAVPLGVAHASSPCEEDWNKLTSSGIPSNDSCTLQCESGYEPDERQLDCSHGVLTPGNFSCKGMQCDTTQLTMEHGATHPCKEGGHHIGHDFACTAQCAQGYEPSVQSLSCSAGELSPASFSCHSAPCQLPNVENAPDFSCEHGHTHHTDLTTLAGRSDKVPSGQTCRPTCSEGYDPTEGRLRCESGLLTPHTFSCVPGVCFALSDIRHAAEVSCEEGSKIEHGGVCTFKCKHGYVASQETLTCNMGAFNTGSLHCIAAPCDIPTDVAHAHESAPCTGSGSQSENAWELASGSTCTPQCRSGYDVSVDQLSCHHGHLTPPSFECALRRHCSASQAMQNLTAGVVSCWEGEKIEHGEYCHAQCGAGETPSVVKLHCLDAVFSSPGSFSPHTAKHFHCESNSVLGDKARCLAPVGVDFAHARPCGDTHISFAEGHHCIPQCAEGYEADEAKLTCHHGSFSPSTFMCQPTIMRH